MSHSSNQNGGYAQQDYTRLAQLISSNIQKIQQNAQDVRRMVEQLGTPTDSLELRERLHQRQHYTNQLSKDTTRFIRDVRALPAAQPASEKRHRKTQIDRLTSDFSDVLSMFKTVQRDAALKEKKSLARARVVSVNDDDSGAVAADMQGIQADKQALLSQEEMEEIEERQAALNKLEKDIVELNEIFKELGSMVEEQGHIIDAIEDHVENAEDFVEEGVGNLKKAKTSASSARRNKIICGIIIAVLIVILILVIVFTT